MAESIYTLTGPRVRCPKCGETRIRRGMLARHLATMGHAPTFPLPDAAVDAEALELRIRFRASIARLVMEG